MTTRMGVRMGIIVVVCLCAGCALSTPEDECFGTSAHCEGSKIMRCEERQYGDWGAYHAWRPQECGNGECVLTNRSPPHDAFCSEGPAEPMCDGATGYVCDGVTSLRCDTGYVLARQQCGSCATSASGCGALRHGDDCCEGSMGGSCKADGDCATGLRCLPYPEQSFSVCTLPCSCADRDECGDCPAGAAYPNSICYKGICGGV